MRRRFSLVFRIFDRIVSEFREVLVVVIFILLDNDFLKVFKFFFGVVFKNIVLLNVR